MGGTAPGLPGPEALEVEWSSSSSEESPAYATKPVFNLFTVGSKRRRGGAEERERWHIWGRRERKKKHTENNSGSMFAIGQVHYSNTFWEKQIVN